MRLVKNDTKIDLTGVDQHLFVLVHLFSRLWNDKVHAIDGEALAYVCWIHDNALVLRNAAGR
jgi:hypothetical protein